ncbi:glucose-6-phosphate 1-dehydrogenase, partial [Pancytospora epiphaga]
MKELIIFGASGDLAKRKLMPALSNISSKDLQVIAYARSPLEDTYAKELMKFHKYETDFPSRVKYVQGEYDNLEKLREMVGNDTICYFSLPPEVYKDLLVKAAHLGFGAIGLEKPFGTSQESFQELASTGIENVYFIDHYLLKPLIVAIPEVFTEDSRLWELLHSKNISSVEAYFCEELGLEGRIYYDKTGCVADVLQNHLAVCLATILAGPKDIMDDTKYSNRLRIIECMSIELDGCLYGQYEGYESDLNAPSLTETFALLPLIINNKNWKDVPFSLIGGKSLKRKGTEIIFNIKISQIQQFIDILPINERSAIAAEEIVGGSVVFNIAPESEVYLKLRDRIGTHVYEIYS